MPPSPPPVPPLPPLPLLDALDVLPVLLVESSPPQPENERKVAPRQTTAAVEKRDKTLISSSNRRSGFLANVVRDRCYHPSWQDPERRFDDLAGGTKVEVRLEALQSYSPT
jgi:hypothetical protein